MDFTLIYVSLYITLISGTVMKPDLVSLTLTSQWFINSSKKKVSSSGCDHWELKFNYVIVAQTCAYSNNDKE